MFGINIFDDSLILFIKPNADFLLKGGKFMMSEIRNSQEGLTLEETFIKVLCMQVCMAICTLMFSLGYPYVEMPSSLTMFMYRFVCYNVLYFRV